MLRIIFCGILQLSIIRSSLATCNTTCFVMNDSGVSEVPTHCGFQYYTSTERDEDVKLFEFDSMPTSDVNRLRVETWPIDTAYASVDLSVKVSLTDQIAIMLSGITDRHQRRCLIICFAASSQRHLEHPDWQLSASSNLLDDANWQLTPRGQLTTLKASCVRLPNGLYNATVLAYSGNSASKGSSGTPESSYSCTSLKDDYLSSKRDVTVLSHSSFPVPLSRSEYVSPWDKKLYRKKRVGERSTLSMQDLLWGIEDPRVIPRCPCYSCLYTNHIYNNKTALLQLDYFINASSECCANCSSLNLVLYQYVTVDAEKSCTDLNFTTFVISGLRLVMPEKNVTQGPVEYPNIGSGCYTFRLRPMVNRSPIYHGFFWLQSHGNVTNMNDWNTTFHLKPNPDKSTLEVRWSAPSYPYNFSHYDIQLWHHKNYSIKCRGENVYDEPIKVIPETGKISLSTTKHLFQNLSRGWYCARVTPVDPRCPPDGCEPRSSRAKLLKSGVEPLDIQEIRIDLVPILIGIVALVLFAGVAVACLVLRCQASRSFFHVAYTKVSDVTSSRFAETQKILLVWTVAGGDGAYLLPVIQAFKKLLVTYSHCEVYDYLELRSIPADQREQLLASPTSWLDSLLNQRSVKIIVVGTEGGRYRQLQWQRVGGMTEVVLHLQPQDAQLFPYLLRRLQDRPDIAADYARIFHVRFNNVSGVEAELEGVVSWTRYNLPQHLRSLTLALHGIKEDDGAWLQEPTSESLQPIQAALTIHPLYKNDATDGNHCTGNHKLLEAPSTPYSNSLIATMENHSLLNHVDVEKGKEANARIPKSDASFELEADSTPRNSASNHFSPSSPISNGTAKMRNEE